ncbi:MAG: GGDEF domain-containing protein [Anaerolineales bacterium]|uniref:GGDEF domain-containing protein n=1 Tax=Candidatus Villigracilis vicinus TaxID=3140679 RepID=UPI003137276C|nr:GGDEF domain-containing protein [Anaerolineales bacterium]
MLVIKNLFNGILPDLKEREGEYQEFYLQDVVTMYSIIGVFIIIANIAMLYLDTVFLREVQNQLLFAYLIRVSFSVFTLGAVVYIQRKPSYEVIDRLFTVWLWTAVFYFLIFNFLRSASHLTTSVDILFIFGAYVFSNIRLHKLFVIMVCFSAMSIVLIFLTKTDVPLATRSLVSTVHFFVQGVGFVSALQTQSFRRTAFLAYIKEREASQLATRLLQTDPLTECLTRRYFFELAERELSRSKRYGHSFCVLMFDLDKFKSINDQFGHLAGDQVLISFVKTVMEQKRGSDLLGRLGGEEFALLLPETDFEGGWLVANRIQDVWAQVDTPVSGLLINSTVSVGVSVLEVVDETFEELLHRADIQMYEKKNEKRELGR